MVAYLPWLRWGTLSVVSSYTEISWDLIFKLVWFAGDGACITVPDLPSGCEEEPSLWSPPPIKSYETLSLNSCDFQGTGRVSRFLISPVVEARIPFYGLLLPEPHKTWSLNSGDLQGTGRLLRFQIFPVVEARNFPVLSSSIKSHETQPLNSSDFQGTGRVSRFLISPVVEARNLPVVSSSTEISHPSSPGKPDTPTKVKKK